MIIFQLKKVKDEQFPINITFWDHAVQNPKSRDTYSCIMLMSMMLHLRMMKKNPDQNWRNPRLVHHLVHPMGGCLLGLQKRIGRLWEIVRVLPNHHHLMVQLREVKNCLQQSVKPPPEAPYLQDGKKGKISTVELTTSTMLLAPPNGNIQALKKLRQGLKTTLTPDPAFTSAWTIQ